ncbi:hypothetical protein GCM10010924_04650 [Rhizobium wenxiniae]|nr:hypothetical protein GCM10010924_04650 [Rhizobium wenxiniae]
MEQKAPNAERSKARKRRALATNSHPKPDKTETKQHYSNRIAAACPETKTRRHEEPEPDRMRHHPAAEEWMPWSYCPYRRTDRKNV